MEEGFAEVDVGQWPRESCIIVGQRFNLVHDWAEWCVSWAEAGSVFWCDDDAGTTYFPLLLERWRGARSAPVRREGLYYCSADCCGDGFNVETDWLAHEHSCSLVGIDRDDSVNDELGAAQHRQTEATNAAHAAGGVPPSATTSSRPTLNIDVGLEYYQHTDVPDDGRGKRLEGIHRLPKIMWSAADSATTWQLLDETAARLFNETCSVRKRNARRKKHGAAAAWGWAKLESIITRVAGEIFGEVPKTDGGGGGPEPEPTYLHDDLRVQVSAALQASRVEWKKQIQLRNRPAAGAALKELRRMQKTLAKVRRRELQTAAATAGKNEQMEFAKDPWRYAKSKLSAFDARPNNDTPLGFGRDEANAFMHETFDVSRGQKFVPPDCMLRPAPPAVGYPAGYAAFGRWVRLMRKKKPLSGTAFSPVQYIVFQKCDTLAKVAHTLLTELARECGAFDKGSPTMEQALNKVQRAYPEPWLLHRQVLAAKTTDTSTPWKCRQITVSEAGPRMFMTGVTGDILDFCVQNQFVHPNQRAFLPGVSGCVELSQLLYATMKACTEKFHTGKKQPVYAALLDIRRAYPTLPHNLLAMVLWWFHLPMWVQALLFHMYGNIMVRAEGKDKDGNDFCSDFVRWLEGIIQGGVESCIEFNLVFTFIQRLHEALCKDRDVNIGLFSSLSVYTNEAFADDAVLGSNTRETFQQQILLFQLALDYSRQGEDWPDRPLGVKDKERTALQLGPGKSLCFAWDFDEDKRYRPYDPEIVMKGLDGELIPVIWVGNETTETPNRMAKHVGRWISFDLKEERIFEDVRKQFCDMLSAIDNCEINAAAKVWIVQARVLPWLDWKFLVQSGFRLTWVTNKLQPVQNRLYKFWLGAALCCDVNVLYRIDGGKGRQSVTNVYKKATVRRQHALQRSTLPSVNELLDGLHRTYDKGHVGQGMRNRQAEKFGMGKGADGHPVALWRKATSHATQTCVRGSSVAGDRRGIGLAGGRNRTMPPQTNQDWGKLLGKVIGEEEEADMLERCLGMRMQGAWAADRAAGAMFYDEDWARVAMGLDAGLVKFAINAICLTLPTPSNMHRWGKVVPGSQLGNCGLCGQVKATLHHILCLCPFHEVERKSNVRLGNKHAVTRPGWRHDNIVREIVMLATTLITDVNARGQAWVLEKPGRIEVVLEAERGTLWTRRFTRSRGCKATFEGISAIRTAAGLRITYVIGCAGPGVTWGVFNKQTKAGLPLSVRKVVFVCKKALAEQPLQFISKGKGRKPEKTEKSAGDQLGASIRSAPNMGRGGQLMARARDWICVCDLPEFNRQNGGEFVVPAGIIEGASRLKPDIIMFSREAMHMIIVEMSAGWDTLQARWHATKFAKYESTLGVQARANGWTCEVQAWEVGCRGLVNLTVPNGMRRIGWKANEIRANCRALCRIAQVSSWAIFRHRNCKFMDMKYIVIAKTTAAVTAAQDEELEITDEDVAIMAESMQIPWEGDAAILSDKVLIDALDEWAAPEPEIAVTLPVYRWGDAQQARSPHEQEPCTPTHDRSTRWRPSTPSSKAATARSTDINCMSPVDHQRLARALGRMATDDNSIAEEAAFARSTATSSARKAREDATPRHSGGKAARRLNMTAPQPRPEPQGKDESDEGDDASRAEPEATRAADEAAARHGDGEGAATIDREVAADGDETAGEREDDDHDEVMDVKVKVHEGDSDVRLVISSGRAAEPEIEVFVARRSSRTRSKTPT